jgi:hypothetical protein
VHVVARFLPASIRRAFRLMWHRVVSLLGDAPLVFFAVVIGVALVFRITVGWVRDAATPPDVAPTFATSASASTAAKADAPAAKPEPRPAPSATATTTLDAEVGAAASVQPLGSPRPAWTAPRPRPRGRRPVHD